MPYSRKVPANRIDPFAWLGKTNWITPTADGYRTSPDMQKMLDSSLQVSRNFAYEIREIINLACFDFGPNGITPSNRTPYSDIYFMSSKVLATGQKTVQLSQEWCEAFENTELTLQFKDYRQPFPTMVIELPANYAESKFVQGQGDYPEFIAIHHEEKERVLLFEVVFRNGQMTTLIHYRLEDTIESILNELLVVPLDDIGFDTAGTEVSLVPFLRIAMNAIVAMTYGSEWQKLERTRDDRQTRVKLKAQTQAKEKGAATKARLRLGTLPGVFSV